MAGDTGGAWRALQLGLTHCLDHKALVAALALVQGLQAAADADGRRPPTTVGSTTRTRRSRPRPTRGFPHRCVRRPLPAARRPRPSPPTPPRSSPPPPKAARTMTRCGGGRRASTTVRGEASPRRVGPHRPRVCAAVAGAGRRHGRRRRGAGGRRGLVGAGVAVPRPLCGAVRLRGGTCGRQ